MADPIIIVPYDSHWPQQFVALSTAMRQALGSVAVRIDHIGSTSIPDLAAKPIVDIQISVESFEPLDAYRVPLERLGWQFRADNQERTKRYFREALGHARTHIHVRRSGSWAEQFALLFRDYMRHHPSDAERYAMLKHQLARDLRDDRHGYTEAKAPFIWEVMKRADEWSQVIGWQPGPSDA